MVNKAQGLSHAKWMCKYHIALAPKHGRKAICSQYRDSLGEIFRQLCSCKGVEIIEVRLMPDRVHTPVGMPPKTSVSSFMGYLKDKSAPMMRALRANLKHEFGSRRFRSEGCCVSTVGLNEATVAKHVRGQEAHDIALDQKAVFIASRAIL